MKKTLEYLYIFSKFSTSLILLTCILTLGYFFYISFKNQEKLDNQQTDLFYNELKQNSLKLNSVSKKLKLPTLL